MKRRLWSGRLLATIALVAAVAPALPAQGSTVPVAQYGQGSVSDPDRALGKNWKTSTDVVVTGAGDSNGFHLYVARERDAFAWSTLATLSSPQLELGPWTGKVCVTGSGRYAVAVFAPKVAANKQKLRQAGALAAVVEIATGKARHVATGVAMSYFNPACGPTDRVLLTRSLGEEGGQTDLLTVDAATATVTQTRRLTSQFTTPAPGPDGDYGMAGGMLVRVESNGTLTKLAKPQGRTFAVRATGSHGVDVVSVDGQRAVAQRFQTGQLTTMATGPWNRLQLFGHGGQSTLVGQVSLTGKPAELATIAVDRQVRAISTQGHLVVDELLTDQTRAGAMHPLSFSDPAKAGGLRITARVPGQAPVSQAIAGTRAPSLSIDLSTVPSEKAKANAAGPPAKVGPGANLSGITGTVKCAVGRNDPRIQAAQNGHQQVEWAVDLAVHGNLQVTRPANFGKTGMPSYTPQGPQGLFERHAVSGGGSVPAQVLLGIVAQETNMSEASWHAVPGDTGNPLVSDYYGTRYTGDLDQFDYTHADCGYGIGQVTTGMALADGDTVYNSHQRIALATDYAANIAASLNVLIDKWNQINDDPGGRSWINGGEAAYVQSWFLATWAYNSGFHPSSEAGSYGGHWGLGYLNNPANADYPANRDPFLRFTYADAETPNEWPYPERIMGWIETPQLKGWLTSGPAYARPNFGENSPNYFGIDVLALMHKETFCSPAMNSCHPNDADPCPEASSNNQAIYSTCWWHGHAVVTDADCAGGQCATEHISYGSTSAEPGVDRVYPTNCLVFDGNMDDSKDPSHPVTVVLNLPDPTRYALNCTPQTQGGKFTLRAGYPAGGGTTENGQVDLHQLGAGYMGHTWFSHGFTGHDAITGAPGPRNIVGAWTPDLPAAPGERLRYDVAVHLPSHGGESEVEYVVMNGPDEVDDNSCVLDQSTWILPWENGVDEWRYIGHYELEPGAQILMNNQAGGNENVAWDAMAFVPIGANEGHACDDQYDPIF